MIGSDNIPFLLKLCNFSSVDFEESMNPKMVSVLVGDLTLVAEFL